VQCPERVFRWYEVFVPDVHAFAAVHERRPKCTVCGRASGGDISILVAKGQP
jgi:hypothetical protein